MSKQLIVTEKGRKYLLVEVALDVVNPCITKVTDAGTFLRGEYAFVAGEFQKKLPEGEWELIGLSSTLTEDQCKSIVEGYIYSGRASYQAYKDYSGRQPEGEHDIITNAGESFQTWINANGFTNCVILKGI